MKDFSKSPWRVEWFALTNLWTRQSELANRSRRIEWFIKANRSVCQGELGNVCHSATKAYPAESQLDTVSDNLPHCWRICHGLLFLVLADWLFVADVADLLHCICHKKLLDIRLLQACCRCVCIVAKTCYSSNQPLIMRMASCFISSGSVLMRALWLPRGSTKMCMFFFFEVSNQKGAAADHGSISP